MDSQVLRACEECANRLKLAEATLAAVQQQLVDSREIIAAKDRIILQQDGIIGRYEKMRDNSAQLNADADKVIALFREQHTADVTEVARLNRALDKARGSKLKWFAAGAIAGGLLTTLRIK